MAKRTPARDDFDSPWKDALQRYLPQFLAFFFPALAADIDWVRGYEALDKEFQQIIRRARSARDWPTSYSRSGLGTAATTGCSSTSRIRGRTTRRSRSECFATTWRPTRCIIGRS